MDPAYLPGRLEVSQVTPSINLIIRRRAHLFESIGENGVVEREFDCSEIDRAVDVFGTAGWIEAMGRRGSPWRVPFEADAQMSMAGDVGGWRLAPIQVRRLRAAWSWGEGQPTHHRPAGSAAMTLPVLNLIDEIGLIDNRPGQVQRRGKMRKHIAATLSLSVLPETVDHAIRFSLGRIPPDFEKTNSGHVVSGDEDPSTMP
ncbi:hypothetical protein [Dokdonella sp.]|uniref:hypothetical protein n=1 Tax=Dokdonella sp. TaxID=2291710 RepID=UPI0035277A9C